MTDILTIHAGRMIRYPKGSERQVLDYLRNLYLDGDITGDALFCFAQILGRRSASNETFYGIKSI